MKKMNIMAAVGASALMLAGIAAAPTAAQAQRYYDRGYDRGRQLDTSYVDSLDWRINNAARMGAISWRTANRLRADLPRVQPIAWRVETGRASRGEYMRLARTVNRIEAATNTYAATRYPPYAYGYRR